MVRKRRRIVRNRTIRAGEFDIHIEENNESKKLLATAEYRPTKTKSAIKTLYPENIDFIERELKGGRIHTDLTEFPEVFLKQYEQAIEKENNFRLARHKEPTNAGVFRETKEEREDYMKYITTPDGKKHIILKGAKREA